MILLLLSLRNSHLYRSLCYKRSSHLPHTVTSDKLLSRKQIQYMYGSLL